MKMTNVKTISEYKNEKAKLYVFTCFLLKKQWITTYVENGRHSIITLSDNVEIIKLKTQVNEKYSKSEHLVRIVVAEKPAVVHITTFFRNGKKAMEKFIYSPHHKIK